MGRTGDLVLDEWLVECARSVPAVFVDVLSFACSLDFLGRRLLSGLVCEVLVDWFIVCIRSVPAGFAELPLACFSIPVD